MRWLRPRRRPLAGATYDPTSHYRAADVFDFFVEEELGADFLREDAHAENKWCHPENS